MKASGSLWICSVLYLCNFVNNVHMRNTKVLDLSNVNSEVHNNIKPLEGGNFKSLNSQQLNKTSDKVKNKITYKELNEKVSKHTNSYLNISHSSEKSSQDTLNNSTKELVNKTVVDWISFFQKMLTSFVKSEQHAKIDFIGDIQKNLMDMYKEKFEDRNEFEQFEDNNLQEETRNKAFIPIMYILGVITTMIKVLVLLTFKGVTIGAILLLATYTYKLKKKHGLDHPHPHHAHHHPHGHYRPRPYYKQVPEPHPTYSHGDIHLSDLQDYYEEPSGHPSKDVLLSQLIKQVQAYSRPTELQDSPTYSSDSEGEKITIPLDPSQQESNNFENLLKNSANDTRDTSTSPSPIRPSSEDPSDVFDQNGLLDPAQSLLDLEMLSPSLASYEHPQKQYYSRYPPGYSRYPYRSIQNPSKRKRIRKHSSRYRSPYKSYSGYGK